MAHLTLDLHMYARIVILTVGTVDAYANNIPVGTSATSQSRKTSVIDDPLFDTLNAWFASDQESCPAEQPLQSTRTRDGSMLSICISYESQILAQAYKRLCAVRIVLILSSSTALCRKHVKYKFRFFHSSQKDEHALAHVCWRGQCFKTVLGYGS